DTSGVRKHKPMKRLATFLFAVIVILRTIFLTTLCALCLAYITAFTASAEPDLSSTNSSGTAKPSAKQPSARSTNAAVILEINCKPVFEYERHPEIELADKKTGKLSGEDQWVWLVLDDGKTKARIFWRSRVDSASVELLQKTNFQFTVV